MVQNNTKYLEYAAVTWSKRILYNAIHMIDEDAFSRENINPFYWTESMKMYFTSARHKIIGPILTLFGQPPGDTQLRHSDSFYSIRCT